MAKNDPTSAVKNRREISITVTGRRTGRRITIPVWFVYDRNALWLLPVYGSTTQWYRNLQRDRAITIHIGKEPYHLRARLVKTPAIVKKVIQQFREKYTAAEINRWYTTLDVAAQVPFTGTLSIRNDRPLDLRRSL